MLHLAQEAIDCDAASKRELTAAAAVLLRSLRAIQAAARLHHLPANPAAVESYHVGEKLNVSRAVFHALSQAIIEKASAERPGGMDTEFVERVQNERAQFVEKSAQRAAARNRARQARLLRNEGLKALANERRKIQYAADRLWPAGDSAHVQARADFQLPARRAFGY